MKRHPMAFRSILALSFVVSISGCAADATEEPTQDSEANLSAPTFSADATPPSYSDVEALDGDALRAALLAKVTNHHSLGYNTARKQMFAKTATGFQTDDGKLECVYTGRAVVPTGSTAVSNFNTEHSWPQSLGAKNEPAKSDLHHLFPVDGHANSSRGNFLFGEPTCAAQDNCSFGEGGSFMGKNASGQNVFEVREEKRGDIARAHFYFAVRYALHIGQAEEAVLRQWSEEDPVDATELRRNAAVQALQNNRNPFVDRPDFVAKIADF